jgi:hypothetical protein
MADSSSELVVTRAEVRVIADGVTDAEGIVARDAENVLDTQPF